MPNLTQRATHRVRDTAQTALARAIQMTSQFLGRFTPGVQTRIVRGVQVSVEVHIKSGADDVSTHAAALTYAAFLSLVPLIMLGLAVTGKLEATATSDAQWYSEFVNSIPGLAPLIDSQQQALTQNATSLGLIGIVTVLWTASTLTNRAQRALGIVFGAPKRVIANRLRALGVTVGLGVTLIATLALTGLIVGLHVEGLLSFPLKVASFLVLLVIDIGYFTLAYWALTPMREIPMREHLAGGVLMAVGWAILSFVGVYLVDRSISHASALYGTLGTVFGLLLFIRLAMWLFLYGAEVTSLVHRIRLGDETGNGVSPTGTSHRGR
jgi:YihY family inner membrane protein